MCLSSGQLSVITCKKGKDWQHQEPWHGFECENLETEFARWRLACQAYYYCLPFIRNHCQLELPCYCHVYMNKLGPGLSGQYSTVHCTALLSDQSFS